MYCRPLCSVMMKLGLSWSLWNVRAWVRKLAREENIPLHKLHENWTWSICLASRWFLH